ncbi:hypothetical protein EJF36_01245 [Bacillus sp. HMF5848]|uniref:hypothetical protein n=1 Tax=Bacillus sp. HMF5848 TaxID=2495421 RepID=UPI000F780B7C|nr:hypothetical protein [Bacillus sp. HMF5848]RSK25646.1 hypothetical protein EJF36_01245 [Bacillus sp. HMF5848]
MDERSMDQQLQQYMHTREDPSDFVLSMTIQKVTANTTKGPVLLIAIICLLLFWAEVFLFLSVFGFQPAFFFIYSSLSLLFNGCVVFGIVILGRAQYDLY